MRYIATGEHYGVARVVGIGNKIDIDESDVLEYYASDPETKAIFVYLESMKSPRRFLEIARETTRHKPIVLLKGGSTEGGSHAAGAHTAALASDDRIIDGALKQAGIARIYKYSHLVLAAKALSAMPLPRGNRVSFLAPSGAHARDDDRYVPEVLEPRSAGPGRIQSPPASGDQPALQSAVRNPVDIWPWRLSTGSSLPTGRGWKRF